MLSGARNKEKKGSIVLRITLWYSSFLFVFILVLLGLAFLLSSNLADAAIDDGIFYYI